MTTIDYETARHNMVEYQIRCCKILDPDLLEALRSMPRESFLGEDVKSLAYMEGRVPLPCNQEMLSPLQEANILEALDLQGSERILEIGSGTGFLTALLAMHAAEVVSLELHPELADMAKNNLASHGISNASVTCANGMDPAAHASLGSFDAIVIGAAIQEIPQEFLTMLNKKGRLVAFVGSNPVVKLVRIAKTGKRHPERTEILETLLQNIEGLPEKREFVF
ncbi:MAG: protein-L-isoaspartate(D-aspartate) O-methyltransferase [Zetaproteobacteria bacterium CG12_big_fil_rev_8_21_14_0_65_55_1124]|nr:MAG: protein-L-isoaspartate(D-aspartate) O-methyltransferase [Zetaproteobacteria bacterium CG1_02_55_237]PIS20432.1 MAG: protein-L-isoaspartate(D-aspartate) O-methyltransferase [Zetaproteobacteria bacterium CG08_land_8_20_14_0_20_55_17]PIW42627.1 MAG: protein-L-isoaspartate(D-aspartate) O-methyltransferase [Zetaproteobacteria bacterium CG12_big_fil_rev_8_21_14_0_65_55_1124]PIY54235.1 MAG: protein-L-isoaspartate(D-aspartate) O-methyltransferase [Zetaproteobacteria bacterium CG_4_10_14_0_8_um_f